MDEKKRIPGVGFWATMGLVVILAYPASFGPAVWLVSHQVIHHTKVERAYWPILWGAVNGPEWTLDAIQWWASLGTRHENVEIFDVNGSPSDLVLFFGD